MGEIKRHRVIKDDPHPDDEYPVSAVLYENFYGKAHCVTFESMAYRPLLDTQTAIKIFKDKTKAIDWFDRFVKMLEE